MKKREYAARYRANKKARLEAEKDSWVRLTSLQQIKTIKEPEPAERGT
jgi:hypothetical protein